MNLSNIVTEVAEQTGMPNAAAKKAVDAAVDAISQALVDGEEVSIAGFGKFRVKTSAARAGRNPKTGEPVNIPASKSVGFKVSSVLKGTL